MQLPYTQQDISSQAAPARQDMMEAATDQLSQQLAPGWPPVQSGSGVGLQASAQSFGAASHHLISNGQLAGSAFCLPESRMPQLAGSDPASELRRSAADSAGGNFGSNAPGQTPGSYTQTAGAPQSFMQLLVANPTGSPSGDVLATPPHFSPHSLSQAYVLDAAQGAFCEPFSSETSAQAVSVYTGLPGPIASTGMTLSNTMHAQTLARSTWSPGPWTSPTRQMDADRAYLPGDSSNSFNMCSNACDLCIQVARAFALPHACMRTPSSDPLSHPQVVVWLHDTHCGVSMLI